MTMIMYISHVTMIMQLSSEFKVQFRVYSFCMSGIETVILCRLDSEHVLY